MLDKLPEKLKEKDSGSHTAEMEKKKIPSKMR